MPGWSFRLLSGFDIAFDDGVVTEIPGNKIKLLLAYLVLTFDMPQSRRRIAFDFWPNSTEKQAHSNLRKLIHDLRECLPQIDRYIEITPQYMQWNPKQPYYSDVREFERAAHGQTLIELQHAVQLYQGQLLPGFDAEWLDSKREWLAQLYVKALEKLVSLLESQREYSTALFFANKLLIHNKLREDTYRTLMRLHALNKDMAGVAQIYEQLRSVLKAELGIDPAEETLQLYGKFLMNGGDNSTVAPSRAPFIGRIGEWGSMLNAWKQATVGKPALLVLRGEGGIGKTRLALEFQSWTESQGIQTAFASCSPTASSLSYTPVITWLRGLPVPQLCPVALSELARLLPELLEQYTDLPQTNPIREFWQLTRFYAAIERMLSARQPPLMLFLDDIQWCDRQTIQFLSYLLRSDSNVALLIIATMRTDESADDAVLNMLSGLRTEGKMTEIELPRFNEEDTRKLMASTIGNALADRDSSGIYAATGGNPLFVVETLREWQTDGANSELRNSTLVHNVIGMRIKRLSSENRQFIFAVAAIGRPVSIDLMAIVLDTSEDAVLETMETLVNRYVLQEVRDGLYDFTHDFIRETAYKLTHESRRRRCHRQIARGLIASHPDNAEAVAAEIAFHFELAGLEREAVPYYEMAASAAEKLYDYETMIHYYGKLCRLLPPERILSVLMKLGEAWTMAGDLGEAEKTYRYWLERSGTFMTIRERSYCDVALGNCLRAQGKYEEAEFQLNRALRHFELIEDHSGLSLVYGTLGYLHYYMGNYDKALCYLQERMELPDTANWIREDCLSFGILGFLDYDQCEYDQAIQWFKKQSRLASENRDGNSFQQAMSGLALTYLDTDRMDQAYDSIVAKMETSYSIGNRMDYAMALGMLGKYYVLRGSREHAAPCMAFCLEEAVLIRNYRIAAIILGLEGYSLMEQHRYEESDPMIARSMQLSRQLRIPYFECDALYYMSLLKRCRHQYEFAAEVANEALDIAVRLRRTDMQCKLLVQLLLLKADMGRISPVEAVGQLQRMLERFPGQREQAAIRYTMWKLHPESVEHRNAALILNEELYGKSGKQQYLVRCRELNGSVHILAAARPMPKLAMEAVQSKKITPKILAEIDRYLKPVKYSVFEASSLE